MTHQVFPIVASVVIALWLVALVGYLPPVAKRVKFPLGTIALIFGWLIIAGYLAWLWHVLERPPLRTMGETRLWFIAFLPPIGLLLVWRFRARATAAGNLLGWLVFAAILPTCFFGIMFLCTMLATPEMLDKSLMPALQSFWFAPHVIVYMIAYSTFGVVALIALITLAFDLGGVDASVITLVKDEMRQLIYLAMPLLTLGLLLGAYWAKIAWGTYWSWDPKETMAFVSWTAYLAYIHLDRYSKLSSRWQLGMMMGAFVIVAFCWFGVNYLPSAENSIHTYTDTK
ncbi:MAG: cytochrome c biogenesis protein CcsA [Armatimonadota bacterium]